MTLNCESNVQYIPYKEIIKQRSAEYYYKNKEIIKERNKNKYDSLTPEEKKRRQEYRKEWLKKLPIEKQQQLKEKARQYHKNRYNNLIVAVN